MHRILITVLACDNFCIGLAKGCGVFSCQTPEDKITKPVKVQMISVSIKGSKIATMPSATGSLVFAAAWAMGAEPCPASLEYRPRFTPRLKA